MPPTVVDHIPPLAEPPIAPVRAEVVPPWQIVWLVPAFAVGIGKTIIFIELATDRQGVIPIEVKVRIAVPL